DVFNETYKRTGKGEDAYMAISQLMMDHEMSFGYDDQGDLMDLEDDAFDVVNQLRQIVGNDPNYTETDFPHIPQGRYPGGSDPAREASAKTADAPRCKECDWPKNEHHHDPDKPGFDHKFVPSEPKKAAWSAHKKIAGSWGERSWDSDNVHDLLDPHRPGPDDPTYKGFETDVPDDKIPA